MLNLTQIQTIIDALKTIHGLQAVYIHGSVAKGTERPDSDIDIAILLDHKIIVDAGLLLEISGELQARIGKPVHIGILSLENVVFAKEVIGYGKRIYCYNKTYCDTFAMYALSFYAELNEQRREVLQAYIIQPEAERIKK